MENMNKSRVSFIAADWGTTNLRVWAIDTNDDIICKRTSDQGMNILKHDEFEPILVGLIEDLLSENTVMPIIICGMAGSKSGWVEAPYDSVPTKLSEHKGMVSPKTEDPRISVKILPGLKQKYPEDVMRGEETQIAGFLNNNANFSGCLCLPGTHTKWIVVENGLVASFQTSLTGEMFSILSKHSILRFTLDTSKWKEQEFSESVQKIMKEPELLLSMLFRIRAKSLVLDGIAAPTEAVLSGLLIGSDVLSAKTCWKNRSVTILGEDKIATLYAHAFSYQKVDAKIFSVEKATVLGLIAAQQDVTHVTGV